MSFCSTDLVSPRQKNCTEYTWLNESSRNRNFGSGSNINNCDHQLSGWYRFGGGAGIKIATSCVSYHSCGTTTPGWMTAAHPTVDDGKVTRKICFNNGNCCDFSNHIEVVNCGQYYVYELKHPPACYMRYCGSDN